MRGAQVGQVSTPTASVLQGLQKTVEANRVDDVVMLLFEEMQTAKNNGHTMPLSVVFVERKVAQPPPPLPTPPHAYTPPSSTTHDPLLWELLGPCAGGGAFTSGLRE